MRRTRNARWSRRANAAFAGRAKAVDKQVDAAATPLAKKLSSIRDAIGASVFGATAKADASNVQALTTAQYTTLKTAIDAIEAKMYADAIYDDGEELVETSYNAVRDLLSLETGFDVVPTWAIDELQSHAEEIANLVADRDRKALTATLDHALSTGMSAKDTATALKETFANGITIYDDHGIAQSVQKPDSYFETVARTELQRASNLGQYALYEAAGVQSVRWQAAEPCDECAEADDVVLDLGEVFPGVDVDMPPAHPRCRCVLIPSDDDLGDFGGTDDDRAAARRGNQPDGGSKDNNSKDDDSGVAMSDWVSAE